MSSKQKSYFRYRCEFTQMFEVRTRPAGAVFNGLYKNRFFPMLLLFTLNSDTDETQCVSLMKPVDGVLSPMAYLHQKTQVKLLLLNHKENVRV